MSLMAPIINLPNVNGGIALGAGTKFVPQPLISEGRDGQVLFAEGARLAFSRAREQAQLLCVRIAKHTVDMEREASLEIIRPLCASGSRLWG
jgi:hypothetical protein